MNLQRLTLLLLGGCMSLTGLGCAALQATFQSPRPISDSRDTTGQRLVAIARVFENQGKYERAETMYRRALRHTPTDTVVRDRLQQLVAQRQGRQFRGSRSATAIAAADSVNGKARQPGSGHQSGSRAKVATVSAKRSSAASDVKTADAVVSPVPVAASEELPAPESAPRDVTVAVATTEQPRAAEDNEVPSVDWVEIAPLPPEPPQPDPAPTMVTSTEVTEPVEVSAVVEASETIEVGETVSGAEVSAVEIRDEPNREIIDLEMAADHAEETPQHIVSHPVVAEASMFREPSVNDVLPPEQDFMDSISLDNVAMLIRTLEKDNLPEERAIAAVLLGDCARDDVRVQIALDHCGEFTRDLTVLQAVCDSQIQRGEQTLRTAECLSNIAMRADDLELRIQAVSALRHFAKTDLSRNCTRHLIDLLRSDEQKVRAAAALTLGDFRSANGESISQLTLAAATDSDAEVRQAALYAMERVADPSAESVEVIGVSSPGSYRNRQPIEIVPAR